MTKLTPIKPWERDFAGTLGIDQRIRMESSATLPTVMGPARPTRVQQVPSVPARPWLGRSQPRPNGYGYGTSSPYVMGGYGSYGGYGGSYGGYGGSYGGYGAYGGYRGYGANRFGGPGAEDSENRFIQLAEEATRPAFDSIQSVVDAFGSVSFMLDSTYQAVVHTFRAVLGIAEHLGQLRSIFAALNVFRLVRWAYRKLCQILGVSTAASRESIWNDVAAAGDSAAIDSAMVEHAAPRWPIFVYFTIVVSGPLLMWRLLKSLNFGPAVNSRTWDPRMEPSSQYAVVTYPFTAQTNRELSVGAGKMVGLAPNQYQADWSAGWALVTADRRTAGLVPLNYMQQVQYAPNSRSATTTRTMSDAAATASKETSAQQATNTFPLVNDVNAPQVPVFTPVHSTSIQSNSGSFDGSSLTVPVAVSATSKLDPAEASQVDGLPAPAAIEEEPLGGVGRQEKEISSEVIKAKQT
ncbi:peroxisomal membrane protein PEX13 [Bacillus rossius redtenbacheri]|uniref:peroxisomal membrane protein PEX13 n=1 Tax=Bacillus rossius redtenbacheri TaxID=93214 RepID=UPI002FDCFB9E